MINKSKLLHAIGLMLLTGQVVAADVAPAPNGIEFPKGYQDWRVISMSHRVDNKTVRIIYGNDKAIEASRAGQTNPWPDGAIIGKVVWKQKEKENWPTAIAPNKFVHAEFMFKDANKYAKTAGWGWARWVGMQQKPFTKGEQACISCHTPVKSNDWVFTEPAVLPPVVK
jgi:hypothetical protein